MSQKKMTKAESRLITRKAIKKGLLRKEEDCQECGSPYPECHHPDYNMPLIIMWLCKKCHCRWHKINGFQDMPNGYDLLPVTTYVTKKILRDFQKKAWTEDRPLSVLVRILIKRYIAGDFD